FSSRRRHTRFSRDWSSDVCSSDLPERQVERLREFWETICRPNLPFMALPDFLEQSIFDMNDATREWLGHLNAARAMIDGQHGFRSEERRVGKEWRQRGSGPHQRKQ